MRIYFAKLCVCFVGFVLQYEQGGEISEMTGTGEEMAGSGEIASQTRTLDRNDGLFCGRHCEFLRSNLCFGALWRDCFGRASLAMTGRRRDCVSS